MNYLGLDHEDLSRANVGFVYLTAVPETLDAWWRGA
jgi:hypothetical protein